MPVKLRKEATGLGKEPKATSNANQLCPGSGEPVSVPSLLQQVAEANPDVVAMRLKDTDSTEWKEWSYQALEEEVNTVARALLEIGLHRHHSVAIVGDNSPHWIISHLAAISAG